MTYPSARLFAALTLSLLLAASALALPDTHRPDAPRGPHAGGDSLAASLASEAPGLDHTVLDLALAAMNCAVSGGLATADRLAVIDFSLPSSEPRLWIFDLATQTLLLEELVAHGRNSGDNLATAFSNREGSYQSSIGLFRASESYFGRHGYSLRMDGLEPGINDLARQRAIVIHGADYVDTSWVERQGRIGRSLGCPAVSREVADQVVDTLKDGQFVFSYYPDKEWLRSSAYLNCQPERIAATVASLEVGGG